MKLKDFMDSRNLDAIEFAKMIQVHPNTVRSLCKNRYEPKLSVAFKIEEVTKGKVTAKELAETWERKNSGSKRDQRSS